MVSPESPATAEGSGAAPYNLLHSNSLRVAMPPREGEPVLRRVPSTALSTGSTAYSTSSSGPKHCGRHHAELSAHTPCAATRSCSLEALRRCGLKIPHA